MSTRKLHTPRVRLEPAPELEPASGPFQLAPPPSRFLGMVPDPQDPTNRDADMALFVGVAL
jgi:hypothetical protein